MTDAEIRKELYPLFLEIEEKGLLRDDGIIPVRCKEISLGTIKLVRAYVSVEPRWQQLRESFIAELDGVVRLVERYYDPKHGYDHILEKNVSIPLYKMGTPVYNIVEHFLHIVEGKGSVMLSGVRE